TKSLQAAANAEMHYFRIAQYLRLSRRAMSLAGLQLISVSPVSRLNDYFPVMSLEEAVQEIKADVGDPAQEQTEGLYRQLSDRRAAFWGPMHDYRPPVNPNDRREKPDIDALNAGKEFLVEQEGFDPVRNKETQRERVRDEVRKMMEEPLELQEEG
ncbi:MAG: hypothetical protein R3C11_16040, partial [Planctomycetaceae bacterium]